MKNNPKIRDTSTSAKKSRRDFLGRPFGRILHAFGSKIRDNKGMTLLELLIGSGILIVAISGILATHINFQYLIAQSNARAIAMQDASAILERIRNISPFTSANVVANFPNGGVVPNFGSLPAASTEQVTVSYTNTSADPLETIITVTWQQMRRPMRVVLVNAMTYR